MGVERILEIKVAKAIAVIRANVVAHGVNNCAIAFSGGKDSMVVADLVYRAGYHNIPWLWCDTKNENKMTYDLIKDLKGYGFPIVRVSASDGINFWSIVKEHGFPQVRGKGKYREPKCCKILKNDPAEKWYKENDIDCVFVGISKYESRQRFMLIERNANKAKAEGILGDAEGRSCGMAYYGITKGRHTVLPIADFTLNNVIEYHELYNLPHCGVYDLEGGWNNRVGCDFCTAYNKWEERMKIQCPKAYDKILRYKS